VFQLSRTGSLLHVFKIIYAENSDETVVIAQANVLVADQIFILEETVWIDIVVYSALPVSRIRNDYCLRCFVEP